MPANAIAHAALLLWTPFVLVLFARLRPPTAAAIAFCGAFLALPANFAFDFRGLPPVDRHVIGGFAALAGYLVCVPRSRKRRLGVVWPLVLIAVQVTSAFLSIATNPDPLHYGPFVLPGLRLYDGLGVAFVRLMTIGVPFYLGAKLIREPRDLLAVLRVVVLFGIAYVGISVFENRMSPKLHTMLYGYFPHMFLQHIRAGGYRPVGFTIHGLELALFAASALIAGVGLWRARVRTWGVPAALVVLVLAAGLVLARSLGPIVYGILFPALLVAASPRWQARAVVALALLVLAYPIVRTLGLFPTEQIVATASMASPERGQSVQFRFDNEDRLLDKAVQRPLFGWGVWGRNRVFDARSGADITVTDGYWIIELGTYGLVGFLSGFCLLLVPVILAARRHRRLTDRAARLVVLTAAMVVLARSIDLLPNAFETPFTFFLSGALMAFATLPRRSTAMDPPRTPLTRPAPRILGELSPR